MGIQEYANFGAYLFLGIRLINTAIEYRWWEPTTESTKKIARQAKKAAGMCGELCKSQGEGEMEP